MAFRIEGIDPAFAEPLFALSDEELRRLGAMRCVAGSDHGFPCRASLRDARRGEELLLLPYAHQPAASPYRATGPIFILRGAKRVVLPPGALPGCLSNRLLSLRAYDAGHMMIDADVCEAADVAVELERLLDNPAVDYVQLHNARRGCFSCVALRH